ncbi:MAG: hypothetical protein JSW41_01635 [Candidatus Aenigmatarchaeota archaeon]|nr:MAG: hypothetical protein JSW41_01635 [Candidatus Aenigmarchaeota archaeon]
MTKKRQRKPSPGKKLPPLQKIEAIKSSNDNFDAANRERKAQERKRLTNYKVNPPKTIHYTDLEKIVKTALDAYQVSMNRHLGSGEPMYITDPKNGTHHQLMGITLTPKVERFDMMGQELISRFNFPPDKINPQRVIAAFQLVLFKKVRTKEVTQEEYDNKVNKLLQEDTGWEEVVSDPDKKTVQEYYEDGKQKVVYHAFYPLVDPVKDHKTKAMFELYQGFINTLVSWGIHHQEAVTEEFTQKKVETDRQKIQEKVKEFTDLVDQIPDEQK